MMAKFHTTILFVMAVALTAPITAQEIVNKSQSESPSTKQLYIDVDFKGGKVSEYVELLRKLDPSARILCSESADRAYVPTIKIKAVPLRVAVNALWTVSRSSFRPIVIDEESFEDKNHSEGLVFSIDLESPSEEIPMQATVVNAKDALQVLGSEDAAEALQATIETGLSTVFADNDGPAVVVKLHEPTGLLFVKGPTQRVRFVLEIIEQLAQNSDQ